MFKLYSFLIHSFLILLSIVSQSATASSNKAPGKIFAIHDGSLSLHLNCQGEGSPTVLLEAGLGRNSLDWVLVQQELAKSTRVCSYDRAGYGWSQKSSTARAGDNIVNELHDLLASAKVNSPYVIVGHSYGGILVRLFAALFPDEVQSIVLVDACHDDQAEKFPLPPITIDEILNRKPTIPAAFTKEQQEQLRRSTTSLKQASTWIAEQKGFKESFVQLKQYASGQLQKPLTVISRGYRTGLSKERLEQEDTWRQWQEDLLQRSSKSTHIIAKESGHSIMFSEPIIIVDAIKSLLTSAIADSFIEVVQRIPQ